MLTSHAEKTPMDLNPPSFPNPRTRQPRPLVSDRPLEAWLHPLHSRRRNRHRAASRLKPRHDAQSRLRLQLHLQVPIPRKIQQLGRRMGRSRKHRGRSLDSERAILQLCLFREHWAEAVFEWWREEGRPCDFAQEGVQKTVERGSCGVLMFCWVKVCI